LASSDEGDPKWRCLPRLLFVVMVRVPRERRQKSTRVCWSRET
jgi:hypothetical protein